MPHSTTKRIDVPSPLTSKGISASAFIKLPNEGSQLPFHKKYGRGMKLGSGAYGEVYCCVEKQTGANRAVKIIPLKKLSDGHRQDSKVYEEFFNEVELLRSLDHPNIMKIYDCGKDDDQCYLVTDVYVGGELFNEIIRREKFSEPAAAYVIKQVLSGVKYLHSRNVVHRDLKPENLLLTNNSKNKKKGDKESLQDEFSIKIIDFGLSTLIRNPDDALRDRVGSAYYIAPEILKRNYGPACDIWSVGVILFVLLSGYPPFSGEDDAEIISYVSTGKYTMEPHFWGKISSEAKDLVRRMMEIDVKKRLTATEALEHPWFKLALANDNSAVNHKPLMVALRNMRAYTGNQSLLKAATLLLGSKLTTQAETEELTKVFRTLDLNHDGRLDRDELIAGYRTLIEARGFCAKLFSATDIVHEVDAVLSKVDFDQNGFIDYSEFISVAMDRSKLFSKDRLRAAFHTFDVDGSGQIDLSELREYCLNTSDAEWNKLLEKWDVDGDGTIDVDEFIAMMESQLGSKSSKSNPKGIA
eukprot:GHVH01004513.1.p1 GENE.GHVH01004513.1~~GHVH01004513.1.p1  ORF type:complete len:584 (+),score=81.74 GHVH01004513.1:177-1754(+)